MLNETLMVYIMVWTLSPYLRGGTKKNHENFSQHFNLQNQPLFVNLENYKILKMLTRVNKVVW